jgi:hypothetical protein
MGCWLESGRADPSFVCPYTSLLIGLDTRYAVYRPDQVYIVLFCIYILRVTFFLGWVRVKRGRTDGLDRHEGKIGVGFKLGELDGNLDGLHTFGLAVLF